MRWAVILVALSACGRLGFDAKVSGDGPELNDGGVDSSSDASLIDAPAGSCIQPGNGCTFAGGLPCSCFGSRPDSMQGTITERIFPALFSAADTARFDYLDIIE